jgi:hypothetical protein
MSPAAAEETMVCAELWLSFGSLVRAYAAAASVNADHGADVVATEQTISVTAGSARLDMSCDPESGAGSWQLTSFEAVVSQGRLQIRPEGRISLDGKTFDLDHAAIDLIASAMKAAAHPARDAR